MTEKEPGSNALDMSMAERSMKETTAVSFYPVASPQPMPLPILNQKIPKTWPFADEEVME